MRRSHRFVATLALCLGCTPAFALETDEVSAAQCFVSTFKAGDADGVTACYAADAVLWMPGGPMAKGTEQIRGAFAWYFTHYTVKEFTIAPMGWRDVGDDKVTWGTYTLVAVAKDTGAETTTTGRFMDMSRKVDGKWVYLVDHASDDPPPPPPSAAAVPAQQQ